LRETSDKGLSFTGNRDPKIQLWGEGFSRRGQWCCERGKHTRGRSRGGGSSQRLNGIALGKLALCKEAVKELSTGGELKGEKVFCARLKALLKFDLGEESIEREMMLGWLTQVRRSVSVQTQKAVIFHSR